MATNHFDQTILNKSRKDKFILTIPIPPLLREWNKKDIRSNAFIDLDKLNLSVYGSIVPDNNVPAIEAPYSGGTIYVSSHSRPAYEPVAVNYTIDNEFNNYWAIYTWLNWLRNEKTGIFNGRVQPKDAGLGQYSTDFILQAKDEYHNTKIQWVYKSAFPIIQRGIEYNYRDGGEIESGFTFVYRSIETELITT